MSTCGEPSDGSVLGDNRQETIHRAIASPGCTERRLRISVKPAGQCRVGSAAGSCGYCRSRRYRPCRPRTGGLTRSGRGWIHLGLWHRYARKILSTWSIGLASSLPRSTSTLENRARKSVWGAESRLAQAASAFMREPGFTAGGSASIMVAPFGQAESGDNISGGGCVSPTLVGRARATRRTRTVGVPESV
jgi:hypothetical protein